MPKKVEVTDAAETEAREALQYYADLDEDAAIGFAEEFATAIEVISKHHGSLAEYMLGTKRHLFSRYPYQLIFRVMLDRVQVVAVANLRRKPGYWKRRLK